MIGLVLIAILSLDYAAYANLNPRIMTVTQQQFITNTLNVYSTQTQTVTSISVVTSAQTVTNTATTGFGNMGNYQNCGYNGCYYSPPVYASINDLCKLTSQNNTVQCSGYVYQPSYACTELAIPYTNPEWLEATAYMYLTLYNLPSNHPPSGTWVTVTGQLNQGYTAPPYGPFSGGCPSNYINVSSIL